MSWAGVRLVALQPIRLADRTVPSGSAFEASAKSADRLLSRGHAITAETPPPAPVTDESSDRPVKSTRQTGSRRPRRKKEG